MQFLLDTSALSELTKPRPNRGFIEWMKRHSSDEACITALSIGEIEAGIEMLSPCEKRSTLEKWLQSLIAEFHDRILPFDVECARFWGRAMARARKTGAVLPFSDGQIAAVAAVHGLTVVTRNARHFALPGSDGPAIVSPWT